MRKRYVQIDGELLEVGNDYVPDPKSDAHGVIPDIQPYRSMQTGEMVTSRSRHREIMRQHGLIEIGNDIDAHLASKQKKQSREESKRLIADIINSRHHNLRY